MRKVLFFAIAGLLAVAGCTREVPEMMNGIRTELTAGREAGPATRSALNEDGENLWSVGDKILVGWAGGKMSSFSSKETEPTETARFTGLLYTNNSGDETLYGIYPAEEGNAVNEDGSYALKYHAEQNAVAGSYDPEAFLAVAQASDKNLAFYNVLGLLKFQVAAENVRKITLKPGATAAEPEEEDDPVDPDLTEYTDAPIHIISDGTAGDGDVDDEGDDIEEPEDPEEPADPGFIPGGILTVEGQTPEIIDYTEELSAVVLKGPNGKNFATETDYYLAVPPCVLENGVTFELLYSDGSKGIVSLEGSKEVERSKIHDVGVLNGAEPEPEPEPEGPDTNGVECVEMAPGFFIATCNVGAESPEEAGNYYAWADLEPKTDYADWDNYAYWDSEFNGEYNYYGITKYTVDDGYYSARWYDEDGEFIGDGYDSYADTNYEDDPARAEMGGDWRTLTLIELTFLSNEDYFDWEWTDTVFDEETGEVITLGGYTVTSHVEGCEGNSIFLPAASYVGSAGLGNSDLGYYGDYWCSNGYPGYTGYPYYFYFSDSGIYYYYCHPYYGLSVRGICGQIPVLSSDEFSNFQSAGYYQGDGGYDFVFLGSEWPEEGLDKSSAKPECFWLGVDIPNEFMNQELDLTQNLEGSDWSFYIGWDGSGGRFWTDDFRSGTLKLTLDEEAGTVEFEAKGETIFGKEFDFSYSGDISQSSNYIWNTSGWL